MFFMPEGILLVGGRGGDRLRNDVWAITQDGWVPRWMPGYESVSANGALTRRLYLLPETRDRYLARLRELMDTVLDEVALQAEIDRMEALVADVPSPWTERTPPRAAIPLVREFIASRRATLEAELAPGPPAWNAELRDAPCLTSLGDISGSFSTTWGTLGAADPWTAGTGTFDATLNGVDLIAQMVASEAGPDANNGMPTLQLIAFDGVNTLWVVVVQIPPALFATGQTVPIDLATSIGYLISLKIDTGAWVLEGLVGNGTLTFSQAATTDGAPVVGDLTATIYQSIW
jgi:hypothetical protein